MIKQKEQANERAYNLSTDHGIGLYNNRNIENYLGQAKEPEERTEKVMSKWSKFSYNPSSDSSEYRQGYQDGMNKAFEDSELDAYYAGVGYGKKAAGDKHIGFNNPEERRQFQRGVQNKDEHFKVIRVRPPSFLERLFRSFSSKKKYKRKKKREKRYEKRRNKTLNRIKRGKARFDVNSVKRARARRSGKRY